MTAEETMAGALGLGVVSKLHHVAKNGNDGGAPADVVSKARIDPTIGNDAKPAAMFVRVRHRKLKGGHPEWRRYRELNGTLVTSSASYDVVHAVRVNGKPRQQFVLGLGSIKGMGQGREGSRLAEFWCRSIYRMREWKGWDEAQRRSIILMATRKGAPLPRIEDCESIRRWGGVWPPIADEVAALVREHGAGRRREAAE